MIPAQPIGYAPGKIRHYAGWASYRRRKFDMQTDLALVNGAYARYWIGQLERCLRPVYWPAKARLGRWTKECLAALRRCLGWSATKQS
jgi:hypothetical protein